MSKTMPINLLLCVSLLFLSACEKMNQQANLFDSVTIENEPITVMTYNVYLGGDTSDVLNVKNLLQVPTEVARVYNAFVKSDFPARASLIAKSIKTHKPHLIGLQEMALIRRQFPGDRILGGLEPATEVVMDFREVLINALRNEGLNYRIVSEVENVDVEMPMFAEAGIVDIRLTDYDIILARGDIKTSVPTSANFQSTFNVEMLGLKIKRGYTAVDATIGGITHRFVNTHIESFSQEIRVAQTHELIEALKSETLPILLLGDFNTEAPNGEAYQLLIQDNYIDTWQNGIGNTCCQDADLRNKIANFSKRIDHIFVSTTNNDKSVEILATQIVGVSNEERTISGIWASDHAGVVAQLMFRNN